MGSGVDKKMNVRVVTEVTIVEPNASTLPRTISYVSYEIMPQVAYLWGSLLREKGLDIKQRIVKRNERKRTTVVRVLITCEKFFFVSLCRFKGSNAGGQNGVVWIFSCEVGSCFCFRILREDR